MAVTSRTLTQVRQEMLRRHDFLGYAATADTIGAQYVADASEFQNGRYGPGQLVDLFINRYNRSGNDTVKESAGIDQANPSRLLHEGPAYSNTTDLDYELLGVPPDELNNSIRTAQRKLQLKRLSPLCRGTDFDMEYDSTANYWGVAVALGSSSAGANVTPSKSTTDVYSGTKSLKLTAAAGGAWTVFGEKIRVHENKRLRAPCIARADVGTLTYRWYDVTNSAYFSEPAISYSGEDWAVLVYDAVVPDNCREAQPVFALSGATDIAYIDCLGGPYQTNRLTYNLPSWMDRNWKVKFLRPARFLENIGDNIYDVYSRKWIGDLTFKAHYELQSFSGDVRPNAVQLLKEGLIDDAAFVWVQAERPLYEAEPLDTESSTTTYDLDELVNAAMAEQLKAIISRNDDPFFKQLLAEYTQAVDVDEVVEAEPAVVPRARWNRMVV